MESVRSESNQPKRPLARSVGRRTEGPGAFAAQLRSLDGERESSDVPTTGPLLPLPQSAVAPDHGSAFAESQGEPTAERSEAIEAPARESRRVESERRGRESQARPSSNQERPSASESGEVHTASQGPEAGQTDVSSPQGKAQAAPPMPGAEQGLSSKGTPLTASGAIQVAAAPLSGGAQPAPMSGASRPATQPPLQVGGVSTDRTTQALGALKAAGRKPATSAAGRTAELLEQVRVAITPKTKTAVLRLDPAELGRLRVELQVEAGTVLAHLIVERPEALAALEQNLPELRAMFEQQGLDVGGFQLELAQDGDSSPFEGHDHQGTASPEPTAEELRSQRQRISQHLGSDHALDLIA